MKLFIGLLIGLGIGSFGSWYFLQPAPWAPRKTVLQQYNWDDTKSSGITFKSALSMHQRYLQRCDDNNEDRGAVLRSLWVEKDDVPKLFEGRDAVVGIRLYLGLRLTNKVVGTDTTITNFLVGVDKDGKPVVVNSMGDINNAKTNEIFDNLPPCPKDCPVPDPFN